MRELLTYILTLLEEVEVHGRRNVKHMALALEKLNELRSAYAAPVQKKEESDDPLADPANC